MAITLTEALHATQDLLRDHAGLVVPPAVLLHWLAQGQKDVAILTLCYQRILTLRNTDTPAALIPGQRTYPVSLPAGASGLGVSNHLATLHILLGGVPLFLWTPVMVGIADVRETSGGGTPRYYYEFAGALGFYPYPNAAFAASTYVMEITYGALPADWTTGESVLPSPCDELPMYFAAVRAAMQRKHWPLAAEWHAHYWTQIQTYRLTSGLQYAMPQSQRQQPTNVERVDEPRRVLLLEQQRAQLRAGRTRRG